MMRNLYLVVMVASAGCASGDDLSGTWNGTWTSRTGTSGVVIAELAQDDTRVQGSVEFTGSPCFNAGDLQQVIIDGQLSGSITAGGVRIDMSATWNEPNINGTYDVIVGGLCTGDTGTVTLMRD